jgi:hypothetical protein
MENVQPPFNQRQDTQRMEDHKDNSDKEQPTYEDAAQTQPKDKVQKEPNTTKTTRKKKMDHNHLLHTEK